MYQFSLTDLHPWSNHHLLRELHICDPIIHSPAMASQQNLRSIVPGLQQAQYGLISGRGIPHWASATIQVGSLFHLSEGNFPDTQSLNLGTFRPMDHCRHPKVMNTKSITGRHAHTFTHMYLHLGVI